MEVHLPAIGPQGRPYRLHVEQLGSFSPVASNAGGSRAHWQCGVLEHREWSIGVGNGDCEVLSDRLQVRDARKRIERACQPLELWNGAAGQVARVAISLSSCRLVGVEVWR